ncbi:HetZ-related protein [Spirulina subsalsa FACHB-351]|uniref:HetZ-related protein n=1 Tax=Spirulina subsalsa FACHB-351 TaxID=234711 RepID=A0ABT3L3M6_9CYAN|nr:HetZ-related protein [Spirulina subsalsa]MCW6036062.1 HetZ-related protein [Spirulina subsalsa FACHB-351]
MQAHTCHFVSQSTDPTTTHPEKQQSPLEFVLLEEIRDRAGLSGRSAHAVAHRIAEEVRRVCSKSDRIQGSGEVRTHLLYLGYHRLNKCLSYFKLGAKQGRVELHSNLSVMVYRHIAPTRLQMGFSGRYNLIEDFLQDFYVESLKAFRRENEVAEDYQPRTQLELAEYMAFTEQYAKRRITLPNGYAQQLIILRAQSFSRRQPKETSVDLEQAVEFAKDEDAQAYQRSATVQQVRSQMVADTPDPWENVKRDRVIASLFEYLKDQGHSDCADYLALKLQDLPASEIDEILGLTPRQRDYLQQRFKYHVDKFARTTHWKLVHQWLDADLDQKLGMTYDQWQQFQSQISEGDRELLALKQNQVSDAEIQTRLGCSAKKLQKRWTALLDLASKMRNEAQ